MKKQKNFDEEQNMNITLGWTEFECWPYSAHSLYCFLQLCSTPLFLHTFCTVYRRFRSSKYVAFLCQMQINNSFVTVTFCCDVV
jgi:hypothetical protein